MVYSLTEQLDVQRLAFDASPNPKAIAAPDGTFLHVNPAFCSFTGYTKETLLGCSYEQVTYPEDLELSKNWIRCTINSKEPVHPLLRKRYLKPNGDVVWGETSLTIIKDDESKIFFLVQIKDITALIQTQAFLENKIAERTKQLQASNEALQSFAYAASHDLREPLNKILAFGRRLEEVYFNNLDDKGKQYLEVMQTAATRMTQLLDDLLRYTKAGGNQEPIVIVDLNEVLQEVLQDLEVSVSKDNATITIDLLPKTQGHPALFRQVFQNLISNALKYKKPNQDPNIQIKGWTSPDSVVITVQDDGIGFDPQYSEKIFTVFTRLHTRFEYPGTGIGLAICRRILDQYGGTITAEGVPNEGALFTLTLPLRK
jgi:PAS domain S-box-containing protein